MSTFMGLAWIDLVPGVDHEKALGEFLDGRPHDEMDVRVVALPDGRGRIESISGSVDYAQLAELVVAFAPTGLMSHAFIAFDHDEYGAEHIVLDVHDGTLRRAYHYFAYPRDDETGDYHTDADPSGASRVPGIEEPPAGDDPGVLVDGPAARAAVAARYGVPVTAVDEAATADALAHEQIGIVGGPCTRWLDALTLDWPGELF